MSDTECVCVVTDETFDKIVLQATQPVLVDFWAEWCNPCRMIAPVLEELAVQYTGKLLIAKVNVDNSSLTASKYAIRSIPSLLLFKNGQLLTTKVGAMTKSQLITFIDGHL